MQKIDTDWFHRQLERRNLSVRSLARFLGVDPSAVSRMLQGERKMSADEQDKIASYLGLSLEEVALRRRGAVAGFSEPKQEPYLSPRDFGMADPTTKMFTKDDIIYKDGKRWFEGPDGLLPLHPAYGCMEGTMTIPDDLDLTAPADADWGEVYEDD